MNIKSKLNLRCLYNRKVLSVVTLLFMVALISLPPASIFNSASPFALGAPVVVTSQGELFDAVKNAPDGESTVIAIDRDITLTEALKIPADKNITLTSDSNSVLYNLRGADGQSTITVEAYGELVLDGIIVTHTANAKGTGVTVNNNGKLTLYSGRIFNNTVTNNGGGVYNNGIFIMSGGELYNNTATNGGGVYNYANFTITGG
ncbi:MAG: hypothetical protein LBE76_06695, partial [Nitrososphaerota archaeon]|nr:hypothetical protein [Nitrososphaerota archaeon]